jgi:hypothetical protein
LADEQGAHLDGDIERSADGCGQRRRVCVGSLFRDVEESIPARAADRDVPSAGQVKEADVGLGGVSISVESAGMKQTASSNFGGAYAFYGVAGRTAIEARMEGYLPKFEQVDVVEDRTYDIQLAPARARTDSAAGGG